MSEPTLQSIQEQLNRIERILAGGYQAQAIAPISESKLAVMVGGEQGLRELNKRRAAEQRRKKK